MSMKSCKSDNWELSIWVIQFKVIMMILYEIYVTITFFRSSMNNVLLLVLLD